MWIQNHECGSCAMSASDTEDEHEHLLPSIEQRKEKNSCNPKEESPYFIVPQPQSYKRNGSKHAMWLVPESAQDAYPCTGTKRCREDRVNSPEV
jgi:hypothetical protein